MSIFNSSILFIYNMRQNKGITDIISVKLKICNIMHVFIAFSYSIIRNLVCIFDKLKLCHYLLNTFSNDVSLKSPLFTLKVHFNNQFSSIFIIQFQIQRVATAAKSRGKDSKVLQRNGCGKGARVIYNLQKPHIQ